MACKLRALILLPLANLLYYDPDRVFYYHLHTRVLYCRLHTKEYLSDAVFCYYLNIVKYFIIVRIV